ncbi:DUF3108 domain-containing protein [Prevotella sp. KH2C16]|uniref:DUF3108 domain-containing protein n=1 Tax=Prevotella sp. KH2C16 TaxID=1855325 RepID=UPI000B80A480|nr:DUF3108 domain-containing protein [Prevotella sp. KH2C16]
MKQLKYFMASAMLVIGVSAAAQCSFHNDAFRSGEFLSYNLYYNWQFVWVKAGTASMYTVQSNYKGRQAYRASLTTRGNNKVDNLFVLRDTLLCYSSLDMEPLYFRKGAREGKRYTVDEVFYSYSGGKSNISQHRINNDGIHTWEKHSYTYCVYDMLNIFLRARSFNPEGWKNGHDIDIPIADGNSVNPAKLRYLGKEKIKADNGKKYRCLKLAYMEKEGNKYKRIVDFYVSDDKNHIPVRLDMFLKFGSAKAFLVGMKGIRNPITAQVR